jgi:hypothetical protein
MKMYKWLLYITNNLEKSQHEKEWDIGVFIVMTLCLVSGIPLMWKAEPGWVLFGIMFYAGYLDQLRHNRE